MVKKIAEGLIKEGTARETSKIANKIAATQNKFLSGFLRFIPSKFQWVFAYLQENIKLETPDVGEIKDKALEKFKKLNQPDSEETSSEVEPTDNARGKNGLHNLQKKVYSKYPCTAGNPLNCQQNLTLQPETNNYCSQCQFPALLPPNSKIRGAQGVYQIESFLENRGLGRLYFATKISTKQPVILKEYLLPKLYFNQQETQQRKDLFIQMAGLNLADGRIQDFRLITPLEAIADPYQERCYLIAKTNPYNPPTLAKYLIEKGAFTGPQVRNFLDQCLQSLESLHGQNYRLPCGLIKKGLTHGNLNLNSILIAPKNQGFLIYLTDFALWENRFYPPLTEPAIITPSIDLKDLGYIAFYLLAGGTTNPEHNHPLHPSIDQDWPAINPALKSFILNLTGLGSITFESAEIARQNLLKISFPNDDTPLDPKPASKEETQTKKWLNPRFIALCSAGLLFLIFLSYLLTAKPTQKKAIASENPTCCLQDVLGIPAGEFTCTATKTGTWDYILTQPNLIAKNITFHQHLQGRLETILKENKKRFNFTYQPETTLQETINQIRTEKADFAIANLAVIESTYPASLYTEIGYQQFASDGLAVFVAFGYAKRENSIPRSLGGSISFENLRKIYTGKITNWKQLGGPDLPIKLYIPTEEEAVRFFEQRVLKDEATITAFRKLINESNLPEKSNKISFPQITPLATFATLRQVIRDFENDNIGSISFGTVSKVFGQCSVYPLALVEGNKEPVSPLVKDNLQPVTPETDLCNEKGAYSPNVEAFLSKTYPLAYPVVVLYPRDNRRKPAGEKFAEILNTIEMQSWLSKTGLVPMRKQPEKCDCKAKEE
ncbi:substrate-binding domain-containing protein [Ancylothrix sp. C2]|uniref:PstS family phosphate ABC transporter substrate-binding protein n=1 Tax=Ancylothrix sp. D3o TaxID=2953691 RepID=UPI0021BA98A6|nr:substrate-binding domain-containing protein [Ancylothrix sp. D3o]MCT7948234.1 substrate-binding domain-containing protein [Ancylothrix sp. D3o]